MFGLLYERINAIQKKSKIFNMLYDLSNVEELDAKATETLKEQKTFQ